MRRIAILLCLVTVAHAAPSRDARIAHLAAALEQLRADPIALDREIYEAVRTRCKPAPNTAPAVACMIGVAREVCGKRNCVAAADVIVTNQHSEHDVLDDMTRMRLVRTSSDYHSAVIAEMRGKFALLAAELALAKQEASLAATIERVCRERDQIARRCEPNAAACIATIPYQRCAAGLVWFVSTKKEESR